MKKIIEDNPPNVDPNNPPIDPNHPEPQGPALPPKK